MSNESNLASDQLALDTADAVLVEDARVKKYIAAARAGRQCFFQMHPNDRLEVVSMLRELLRHRKQEHDSYWGEDDE